MIFPPYNLFALNGTGIALHVRSEQFGHRNARKLSVVAFATAEK
jgi:hypothetical protein